MNARRTIAAAAATFGVVLTGMSGTSTAVAAKPTWTLNCAALHVDYPHGVGRKSAHDSTSGSPVTNFKHSTRLYKKAMKANKGLDRDKDKIACEA